MMFNEGKACDAVIRVLEAREGQTREDLRSPEQDGHAAPIELTCRIGNRLFAFEHTGIEPFPGHVQLQAEAKRHFHPIEAMLAGKLPPTETFELRIPVRATQGLRTKDLQRVQGSLAAWVEAARTVLVLEDNDIQLTNPQNVFDTLKAVECEFSNKPDEIYLVGTIIENPWYVWALRVDDRDYYTLCGADQYLTEVDANSLSDLTGRPRLKA
jgi:hypothetical protein